MHLHGVRQREGHYAQHHREGVALLIGIAAKAPDPADGERKIVVALLQQAIHLARIQIVNLFNQSLGVVRLEHGVQQALYLAADLKPHAGAGDDEHIRPAALYGGT